uniref:Uncharacterized protein n=1 Tax=Glossina palpalis gambiensis TaxID=67801 RepID=A0A1B0BAC3_9MUSC
MIDEENQWISALDCPISKLSMTLNEKNIIFHMGLDEVPLRVKVASMFILMSIQAGKINTK